VVPATDRPKAPAWVVGKLVHEALAAWRIPEDRDDELFGRWLGGRARAIGLVDRRQVAHAVRRTRRLLMQLRAHPLFRELATAQQRLHEVPYSLAAQGRLQTGQMDLLYRRDGTWTLVEFKTDEVRHAADVKGLLRKEDYVIQVQQYAAAAEQLVGPRPRCLLCLLDVERRTELYSVPPTGPVERLGP
jgi:ATP-dependent exoDNAse (exonuclease V) beta subunit